MPGDRDDREIFIPGDMEEIVDWALGDISTGFLDYATAYGISSGLPENIQNYVSQLETLKEPDMISNYVLLPSLSKSLQELNEDNYNVYGGLGPVYTAYSDVVFTIFSFSLSVSEIFSAFLVVSTESFRISWAITENPFPKEPA